ncbi:MAG: hypothetical protein VW475_11635 [Curvibacter sp.]
MGEWSDYFEDFPDENPANQPQDKAGDALRARVAREARYSPELLAKIAEERQRREAKMTVHVETRRVDAHSSCVTCKPAEVALDPGPAGTLRRK